MEDRSRLNGQDRPFTGEDSFEAKDTDSLLPDGRVIAAEAALLDVSEPLRREHEASGFGTIRDFDTGMRISVSDTQAIRCETKQVFDHATEPNVPASTNQTPAEGIEPFRIHTLLSEHASTRNDSPRSRLSPKHDTQGRISPHAAHVQCEGRWNSMKSESTQQTPPSSPAAACGTAGLNAASTHSPDRHSIAIRQGVRYGLGPTSSMDNQSHLVSDSESEFYSESIAIPLVDVNGTQSLVLRPEAEGLPARLLSLVRNRITILVGLVVLVVITLALITQSSSSVPRVDNYPVKTPIQIPPETAPHPVATIEVAVQPGPIEVPDIPIPPIPYAPPLQPVQPFLVPGLASPGWLTVDPRIRRAQELQERRMQLSKLAESQARESETSSKQSVKSTQSTTSSPGTTATNENPRRHVLSGAAYATGTYSYGYALPLLAHSPSLSNYLPTSLVPVAPGIEPSSDSSDRVPPPEADVAVERDLLDPEAHDDPVSDSPAPATAWTSGSNLTRPNAETSGLDLNSKFDEAQALVFYQANVEELQHWSQFPELHPHPDEVELLVLGDWGAPSEEQRRVGRTAAQWLNGRYAPVVISSGDQFYPKGLDSPRDFRYKLIFDDAFKEPELQVPWLGALGNHDCEGSVPALLALSQGLPKTRLTMPSRYYFADIPVPVLPPTGADDNESDSGHRFVRVIILDTCSLACESPRDAVNQYEVQQCEKMAKSVENESRGAQIVWLSKVISDSRLNSTIIENIVIGHHPMFTMGPHMSNLLLVSLLRDVVADPKTRLVVSGHDHTLQHFVFNRAPRQREQRPSSSSSRPSPTIADRLTSWWRSQTEDHKDLTLWESSLHLPDADPLPILKAQLRSSRLASAAGDPDTNEIFAELPALHQIVSGSAAKRPHPVISNSYFPVLPFPLSATTAPSRRGSALPAATPPPGPATAPPALSTSHPGTLPDPPPVSAVLFGANGTATSGTVTFDGPGDANAAEVAKAISTDDAEAAKAEQAAREISEVAEAAEGASHEDIEEDDEEANAIRRAPLSPIVKPPMRVVPYNKTIQAISPAQMPSQSAPVAAPSVATGSPAPEPPQSPQHYDDEEAETVDLIKTLLPTYDSFPLYALDEPQADNVVNVPHWPFGRATPATRAELIASVNGFVSISVSAYAGTRVAYLSHEGKVLHMFRLPPLTQT